MSYVEAIENASPRQLAARQEYLERRKRLGGVEPEKPRPVLKLVKAPPAEVVEPVAAPPVNPEAILVAEVDIIAEFPILLTEIPIPFRKNATLDRIKRVVCAHYKISRANLVGQSRINRIVRARQIAMYLTKTLTLYSLPEIGRRFGGKDHTTVLHSYRKIAALMERDVAFATEINALVNRLKQD